MGKDPKTELLKRVVERAGASQGAPEDSLRPSVAPQKMAPRHWAHFTYGAQGAELAACVVCELR
jgi:hypothetical protein